MKYLLMILPAAALVGCTSAGPGGSSVARFTSSDADATVRPQDDFYQATNGGWIAQHPIPADRSRYGAFDILYEEAQDNLRALVEEAAAKKGAAGSPEQMIGDLYALGMDTARRDAEGLEPIKTWLDLAQQADPADAKQFATTIARIHRLVGNPFFAFGRTPDYENSDMNIAEVWQSGLGLPDRDYYFDESERGQQVIVAYKRMLSRLLALAGRQEAEADAIFDFEKSLAAIMNRKEENRDPKNTSNKRTLGELPAAAPGFDWSAYLAELQTTTPAGGAQQITCDVNVAQPKYFSQLFATVSQAPVETVRAYLTVRTLAGFTTCLSSDLYAISFDFYSRMLSGTEQMRPLWKRTLSTVDGALGEELGKLYVAKHFPEAAKGRTIDLIEHLRGAFEQRIGQLAWMSDSTKTQAIDKLRAIDLKVGYPDKWKDYSDVVIDPAKPFCDNLLAVAEHDHREEMAKIGQPVDKTEWYMTPQTVNAYYNPTANEIVFPAGILQPPFFYAAGDDAVNYGAIGVVIGHEMTHGFDDQGCQYDKRGNLSNWWTDEDHAKFDAITRRMEERFSQLVVLDTIKGNGKLTLGENIADLGGLNIAHQAFRNTLEGQPEPAPIDGQSAEQRFLLAYSRVWAGNIRKEALMQQVMTDPHSAEHLRVNGQLPLCDFFYAAYDVKQGDKMWLPEEDRIQIW